MKKQIIVIAGIILSLGAGYYLGQNQANKRIAGFTLLPEFSSIKNWSTGFAGTVVLITPGSITVSSGNQNITSAISQETKVEKIIVTSGKVAETIKDLSLADIKQGSKVSIYVKADLQGAFQAVIIGLQETK